MMSLSRRFLSTVSKGRNLPRLVVFDLDHTVWPFGIDQFTLRPPFHFDDNNRLVDMHNQEIRPFPDVYRIFGHLREADIRIAFATRTKYPTGAMQLIDKLRFHQFVSHIEISSGSKVYHFNRIRDESGVPFDEMMFFDDEERNIVDIAPLGVHSVLVSPETGVTEAVVHQELDKYANNTSNAKQTEASKDN